jgi:hydroxypyruvate isomerase
MTAASICLEMIYNDEPFTRRIDRVAELGFDAVEFWNWKSKDLEAIEARLHEHDLALTNVAGVTEQAAPEDLHRAMTDPETRAAAVSDVEESIEVAQRLDCSFLTVHLGPEQNIPYDRAYESMVEGVGAAAAAAEDTEVTLLLEPLNRAVDHDGYFLERSGTAYEIVDDIGSPALGVLFDVYHQQITEGNIISNLRHNLEYIEHVHVADVPGRHEPGTGELNHRNILEALEDAGYDGYVGFEFTPEAASRTALETIADLVV